MKPITFKQFVKTYNFRHCGGYDSSGDLNLSTKTVRIYYTDNDEDWFEFGAYDFDNGGAWDKAKQVFNEKILHMTVNDFCYDDNKTKLCVYLKPKGGSCA